MAEVDKRHYNLFFLTNTVQLPVQIHMATDADLFKKFHRMIRIQIQMILLGLSLIVVRFLRVLIVIKLPGKNVSKVLLILQVLRLLGVLYRMLPLNRQ